MQKIKELLKRTKYKKLIIGLFIALVVLLVIYIFMSASFIFSKDGWNENERQINSSRSLFTGGGNEPGWNFKIRGEEKDSNLVAIDLITDYGDHSWSGVLGRTWQENYDDNFQYRGDINELIKNGSSTEISSTTKNIIIYFEKKECFDDAGKIHTLSVNLNLNSEKEFKGCADLVSESE